MKTLKQRGGWLFLGGGALALSVMLQYLCPQLLLLGAQVLEQIKLVGEAAPELILQRAYTWYKNNALWATLFYHIAGTVIFGLCCRALCKGDVRIPLKRVFYKKSIGAICITGISLQFFVSSALQLAYLAAPLLLHNYRRLIEASGLQAFSSIALFITAVAAPVGEELLCRGVILHCAQKAAGRFWMANIIQAVAFGVMHMNWVQALYAFTVGLVLGLFYHRYGSLWASIALHIVFNVSGVILAAPLLGRIPLKASYFFLLCLLSAAACALGLNLDKPDAGKPDKT